VKQDIVFIDASEIERCMNQSKLSSDYETFGNTFEDVECSIVMGVNGARGHGLSQF